MKSIFHNHFSKYFPILSVSLNIINNTEHTLQKYNSTKTGRSHMAFLNVLITSLFGRQVLKVILFCEFLNSKNKQLEMREPAKWYCY